MAIRSASAIVSASDFATTLNPAHVKFTVVASASPMQLAEVRALVEHGKAHFPSLFKPISPYLYLRMAGIGHAHVQGILPPPYGTYIIRVRRNVLDDESSKVTREPVIGACGIMSHSLNFGRLRDVIDRPITETDLPCDAFFDVPFLLNGLEKSGALDIVLNFLAEQAQVLAQARQQKTTFALVATKSEFARFMIANHQFEPGNPASLWETVPGNMTPFEHYVLYRTFAYKPQ